MSRYCPPPSGKTIVNRPRASVVRVRATSLSSEITWTCAPGTGALSGPVTTPVMMSVVAPTWARSPAGTMRASTTATARGRINRD